MALSPDPLAALRELPCGRRVLDALARDDDTWVVGGAVRDVLLGRDPREIDLATRRDALTVAKLLGDVTHEHDRFGTAKATAGACVYDVAGTRTETYAAPGALPEVRLGAELQDDLRRRDFTINAVAMGHDGQLVEYSGARSDIEAGVVRVLHDRSFEDDPTRLWRLVRYSVRLGFAVDPHTSELAAAAVAGGALETVSGDRLGAELRLALGEPDPLATLHAARNLGLTPPLTLSPATLGTALEIAPAGARTDLLILGSALGDAEWPAALGFTAAELAILIDCIDVPPAPAGAPSKVAAALRNLPDEAVALAGAWGDRQAAESWLLKWRAVELEIDGDDLIAAGIEKGPEVGRRLRDALDAKLDGAISGRDAELARALR